MAAGREANGAGVSAARSVPSAPDQVGGPEASYRTVAGDGAIHCHRSATDPRWVRSGAVRRHAPRGGARRGSRPLPEHHERGRTGAPATLVSAAVAHRAHPSAARAHSRAVPGHYGNARTDQWRPASAVWISRGCGPPGEVTAQPTRELTKSSTAPCRLVPEATLDHFLPESPVHASCRPLTATQTSKLGNSS